MTLPTSVIALFCEDIREEKSGAISLIGVLGDNVNVPLPPPPQDATTSAFMVPKIGIYVRINFDVTQELPQPIVINLRLPDGAIGVTTNVEDSVIAEARRTQEKSNPIAGIVSKIIMGGFIPGLPGRITIEVTVGQQTFIGGTLNFEISNETVSPSTTASPPPS